MYRGIAPCATETPVARLRHRPREENRAAWLAWDVQRAIAMRCLITGGAGFIGSHLVEHLVGAGHDVVVLDDLSTGRRENFAAVRRRISFMRGSVADLSTCRRAMDGVDYVLHHAAVTSVQSAAADPMAAHAVNATGTLNVLIAARDARVRRVVYGGSTSAYGNATMLPNREDHAAL